MTYLLVGRKHSEAGARGLVLVRSAKSPESNGPATELSEPALQFRLGSVMWQATEVKNLAPLGEEGPDIGVRIHRTGEDFGMLVRRLRLANQTPQDPGESNGLIHGTARRGGGQCLQVEGQVVLDGGRRLDGLDLEGGADVGERTGAERERFRVVGLPALIFGAQVESPGVLQVCRQHDRLVTSLAGQLHAQIPRIQRHKRKLEMFAGEVFLGKGIESGDGVAEGTCGADVLPCESRQTRYTDWSVHHNSRVYHPSCCSELFGDGGTGSVLQRGVIGVLTGLTRTLSRCNYTIETKIG